MSFQGKQKTLCYIQTNHGSLYDVFPLLDPVREEDWLDGWNYKMIHSHSGFIEKDCVFTTPHHSNHDTVWHVTQYEPMDYSIEFLRVTPGEYVARINIDLEKIEEKKTNVHIHYQYTGLNDEANFYIENQLKDDFCENMKWREKAINHYLKTGQKLLKKSTHSEIR